MIRPRQDSNHWAKESTPWRSCQRLIIYTEAMHDLLYADIRNTT